MTASILPPAHLKKGRKAHQYSQNVYIQGVCISEEVRDVFLLCVKESLVAVQLEIMEAQVLSFVTKFPLVSYNYIT